MHDALPGNVQRHVGENVKIRGQTLRRDVGFKAKIQLWSHVLAYAATRLSRHHGPLNGCPVLFATVLSSTPQTNDDGQVLLIFGIFSFHVSLS